MEGMGYIFFPAKAIEALTGYGFFERLPGKIQEPTCSKDYFQLRLW
jgi:hypothetical protein